MLGVLVLIQVKLINGLTIIAKANETRYVLLRLREFEELGQPCCCHRTKRSGFTRRLPDFQIQCLSESSGLAYATTAKV